MLLTQTQNPIMGDTHKILSRHKRRQKVNILRLALTDGATSLCLCFMYTVLWGGGGGQRRKLSDWLLPCIPNETGKTRKYVGIYGTISP